MICVCTSHQRIFYLLESANTRSEPFSTAQKIRPEVMLRQPYPTLSLIAPRPIRHAENKNDCAGPSFGL